MPTPPAPPKVLEHGPRLSVEEYERRVVALHEGGPAMPTRDEDLRLRRAEFELAVDHRLGVKFPAVRRERLWAAQQRMERRKLWHLLKGLATPGGHPSDPLTRAWVAACADVLDPVELQAYFELSDDDARSLSRR